MSALPVKIQRRRRGVRSRLGPVKAAWASVRSWAGRGVAAPCAGVRSWAMAFAVVAWVAWSPPARADALDAVDLSGTKVHIDGMLREWGRLDRLSSAMKGRAGDDPKVQGSVGYDDKYVYVAMKVEDAKLVRTRAFGRAEDYGALVVSFPKGRGYRTYEVLLYAGNPGKSSGAVKLGGGKVRGAKIVEMEMDGGYTFEARIPWSAFPEASTTRVGLLGSLRYADADRPGVVGTIVATSGKRGRAMPPLRLEAEQALKHSLLDKERLLEKPDEQATGNVAGDRMREVVAVYGSYLTIVGPRYRGGKQFYFNDLGTRSGRDVTRLELVDLTGDGRSEIVIQKRIGDKENYREVVEVLTVGADDTPERVFLHEIAVVTEEGEIRNDVTVKGGKRGTIVIAQDVAKGFDPGTYAEPVPADFESALMPWTTVLARTYRWDGKTFEKADEKTGKPRMEPPSGGVGANRPVGSSTSEPVDDGPPAPPPPRPPSADELLDQVYAIYRKDRGVRESKPRFDFVTDVAADTQTERVLVHGRDIVVFGKGFREGRSYTYLTVAVDDPEDIADATARDLTGDGKAEVIVRGVRHTKTSEELGGVTVDRHLLLVYKVMGDRLKRIFGAETGRVLESNRIIGAMVFEPTGGHGIAIELRPGRAIGWDAQSYPFPEDRQAAGGMEPLLLPWGTVGPRRYQWGGEEYTLE